MIALELFACAGGIAEGFRRAGIDFAQSFDLDPDACDSYEANLGRRPRQIDVRELLELVRGGWSPGEVGLLVADPPCTPWSRAGKRRGTSDTRDLLVQTCELVRALRPLAYLITNVPGLQDSPNWTVVSRTIGSLYEAGYCVNDEATLDAADFGVPQRRIRPFWFGHRVGRCIRWPQPTHGNPDLLRCALPGFEDRKPWVTCREALGHLEAGELGRTVRVRAAGERGGRLVDPNRPPADPDAPHRALTGVRCQALLAWPWDRPATTVQADPRIAPPGHHSSSYLSSSSAVVLSERGAALLQGFPEGWVFAGRTKSSRWSQIGQATPPGLAQAVASSIRAWWAELHEA